MRSHRRFGAALNAQLHLPMNHFWQDKDVFPTRKRKSVRFQNDNIFYTRLIFDVFLIFYKLTYRSLFLGRFFKFRYMYVFAILMVFTLFNGELRKKNTAVSCSSTLNSEFVRGAIFIYIRNTVKVLSENIFWKIVFFEYIFIDKIHAIRFDIDS